MPVIRRTIPALIAFSLFSIFALIAFFPAAAHAATPTTITLTVTSSCLTQGCAVTLTAKVTAGTLAVHPGLVYFCEGTSTCETGVPVGQSQLTSNGTASIAHAFFTGSHSIYAIFAGTSTYSKSTSSSQSLTIAPPTVFPTQSTIQSMGSTPVQSYAGQYTLQSTVTALQGGPAATGTVSFFDTSYGNAALGSTRLSDSSPQQLNYVSGQLDFSQIPSIVFDNIIQIATGDVNNDGFSDIAIMGPSGFFVLLGSASGKFALARPSSPNLGTPVNQSMNPMRLVDLNSDGKLDLVATDFTTRAIRVSLGNGDGTFTDRTPSLLKTYPGPVYVGDLNNDGIPDVVIDVQIPSTQNPSLLVHALQIAIGNGDGSFKAIPATYLAGQIQATPVLIADEDKDGKQDLIVQDSGTFTNQFQTLRGNGDGTFKPIAATTQNPGVKLMVGGDFNGDGLLDIVSYDGDTLSIWEGVGDGTFVQPDNGNDNIYLDTRPALTSLLTDDFNHDGKPDLAVEFLDSSVGGELETLEVLKSDASTPGVPFFEGIASFLLTDPLGRISYFSNIVTGDFNGDGFTDIVEFTPALTPQTNSWAQELVTPASAASAPIPVLSPAGPHQIVARYSGDATHTPSVSPPVALVGYQVVNDSGGFTNASSLFLNGGATIEGGVLQLTDGKSFEARSAFYPKRLPVYDVNTSFEFQIPEQNSDGVAFVIQSNGPNAIGSNGGGIGYGQLPGATSGSSIINSLALVFDTHNNQGEGSNSVRIEQGGITSPASAIDLTPSGIDLHSGHHFLAQIGIAQELSLNLVLTDMDTGKVFTNSFSADLFGDIGTTTAYVGFTSATGATASTVKILNWTFTSQACCDLQPTTDTLPAFQDGFTGAASKLQLNNGAAIVGSTLQLTNSTPFEATSAYFKSPTDSSPWVTDFDFSIEGTGGDGFTFLLQDQGLTAVGTPGGALGYGPYLPDDTTGGIGNSLAIKFDLHNNSGEGPNSTGLYLNGAYPSVPAVSLNSGRIDLHSGHRFHARILYFYQTDRVEVSITDLDQYAVFDSFLNNGSRFMPAYAGFTAGTGATSNTIKILNWNFSYYDVDILR
ncbi:hypothetical protein HDF16_002608 [Granulicella aggregans]|uniref:VCBS repeat protein n=1 Tax=Granulicella aggregans TaxID=474949 RepID=A0A7W8E3T1_9BACT|nr:FG-GAP-like repeat-containing protein [Granulicella aggregans]MBB5057902.1 hypothetical protein [Granulicella aggregans]